MTIDEIKGKYGVPLNDAEMTKREESAARRNVAKSLDTIKSALVRSINSFTNKVIDERVNLKTAQDFARKLESLGRMLDTYK
jgi:hypothetical protein